MRKDIIHNYYSTTIVDAKKVVTCNYCHHSFIGSDRERMYKHLIKCNNVDITIRTSMELRFDNIYSKNKRSASSVDPPLDIVHRTGTNPFITLGPSSSTGSSLSIEAWNTLGPSISQTNLQKWIDNCSMEQKTDLDCTLVNMFYQLGLPFSLVDNPVFRTFIQLLCPSYIPPNRKQLTGEMLKEAYERLRRNINIQLRGETGNKKHLTLVTDAWTNIRGESIINYMFVTSNGRLFFYNSDPSGNKRHIAEYLSSELIKYIEEVRPQNVNTICTDTTSNIKAAVNFVITKFLHIYPIGCNSYQFNLVIKDILELPKFAIILKQAVSIAKYFRNHHIPMAELRTKQIEDLGKEIALRLPVATRWQSNNDCLVALIKSHGPLESVVIMTNIRQMMAKTNISIEIRAHILDNEWWCKVDDILKIIQPFLQIIISMESNKPKLSRIYSNFQWLRRILRKTCRHLDIILLQRIEIIIQNRWKKIASIPILLASILDISLPETRQTIVTPDINACILQWFKIRYNDDNNLLSIKIYMQYVEFCTKSGIFDRPEFWATCSSLDPILWWKMHFNNELSELAQDILLITLTSGAAERNWSTFGFIHNKSRNRLKNEKINMLVYIYSNACLMIPDDNTSKWFDDLEVPEDDDFIEIIESDHSNENQNNDFIDISDDSTNHTDDEGCTLESEKLPDNLL